MRRALIIVRIAAVCALGSAAGSIFLFSAATTPSAAPQVVPPAPAETDVALRRAGIFPECLAASGATGIETSVVVEAMQAAMTEAPGALAQADSAMASARLQHDALKRTIEAGLASPEQVASFPA